MRKRMIFYLGSLAAMLFTLAAVGQVTFSDDKAELNFPQTVTFSASIQSETEIKSIVLEYGTDQITCGNVIAKAFPDFPASKNVNVAWKWDMRQSGSIPPGASLWWQWVVTDTSGRQTTSQRKTVTWLDSVHQWQTLNGDGINLHWYQGDQNFGSTLHGAAADALKLLASQAGLKTDQPVDIYIYGQTQDMRDAVLYEPGWTGGLAYPPYNIVIIGINQDILDWGKLAEAHELTHVVTGHLTFNCLWSVPSWLDEGLAMYSEGKLEAVSQDHFDQAVRDDTLIPLRSLSGGFSEKSDKADLSYSESFSVIQFLLKTYGHGKMTALLEALHAGNTADEALQATYGFDTEGLEDAWRAGIGAKARALAANATPTSLPTFVPTIRPVSDIPGTDVTPVATPAVTPQTDAGPTSPPGASPTATTVKQQTDPQSQWVVMILVAACCVLAVLVIVVLTIILVSRRNRSQSHAQE